MSDVVPFLSSLGHALAAIGLYAEGHPARQRATAASLEELRDLIASDPELHFTFLSGEVVYRGRVLRELRWEWASHLEGIGIERLEFIGAVPAEEYQRFLDELHHRLDGKPGDPIGARQFASASIRFGPVTMGQAELDQIAGSTAATTIAMSLGDETETIGWVHNEVKAGGALPLLETETVVRSLAFTMHAESRLMLPLLQLKEFDEYTATHASNVAVLAMGLAEHVGLGPREVRTIGIAGLLHDLGKVRIPKDILTKPGKLTEQERRVIERHPVEGARIILADRNQLDMAAVVAYEHHLWLDERGYPALRFGRDAHYVSRLVHVCDIYDALCTDRPYRAALSSDVAIGLLSEQSGTGLDPELTMAFTRMIREARLQRLTIADPVVSVRT
jgi:HD-GYP domain-containing protein (c-di-GMP phosphodiesterase class II)